ncbi:MAG: DMT family transporter [Deltaproteobacteria bacterium]|nr:DMT family transporter [Deltaproteobacteria bacterium]
MPSPLLLAFTSILLWSARAWLGTLVAHVPPFLLVGVTLLIGSLPGLARAREFTRDPRVLASGIIGLFGYHFCLFMAFRLAPPVEANLVNYLWPVLIVLFSPLFLKGYGLRWYHLAGGAVAFTGAALVATGGHLAPDLAHLPGMLLALAAAVIWAAYSVLTKRLPPFSTAAVAQFCLVAGVLSLASHAWLEPRVALAARDWAILVALGLGPMGVAFYTWDAALKRGDPRLIGALSYLDPLLSTLVLVVLGGKQLGLVSAVAMVLIVAGAVLGSLELFQAVMRARA